MYCQVSNDAQQITALQFVLALEAFGTFEAFEACLFYSGNDHERCIYVTGFCISHPFRPRTMTNFSPRPTGMSARAEPEASVSAMGSAWCSFHRQAVFTLCIVALCVRHCASQSESLAHRRRSRLHTPVSQASPQSELELPARTLRFELCNGFANQRIALATGIVLARLLDRSAVLPEAVANGTQATDHWQYGQLEDLVPLSDMYDIEVGDTWPQVAVVLASQIQLCTCVLPMSCDL